MVTVNNYLEREYMFKHLSITELSYQGNLHTPDFVAIGESAGSLLHERVSGLFGGHTFVVLCFKGFYTYNNARSVGFAVKEYLKDKGLVVVFTAMEDKEGYCVRIKATNHNGQGFTYRPCKELTNKSSSFEAQYGDGSRWYLSHGAKESVAKVVTRVTRGEAPKNLDTFPSTWHEVASDSVTEFYSSIGVIVSL
jgi:hypothetical protein